MKEQLKNIIDNNKKILSELKITVDELKNSELGFIESAEQADLFSSNAYMRITLFESCRLYIQILNLKTEETIYFFDDYLDEDKIEKFIMRVIRMM